MSKKLYEKMNLYLANQEVAYIKLHNLHWYVKGRSFFTLHAKLEELYDQTAEIIDAVAEAAGSWSGAGRQYERGFGAGDDQGTGR